MFFIYDLVIDLVLPSIYNVKYTLKKPEGRNVCIKQGPVSGLQLTSFFIQLIYKEFSKKKGFTSLSQEKTTTTLIHKINI